MKHLAGVTMILAVCATSAMAQAQPPAPRTAKPATPSVPVAPAPRATTNAEPVNIRYEIAIREVGGPQAGTKTVTMTVALGAGEASSIRAQGTTAGRGNNPLNIDVSPMALRDGKVRTRIGFEYTPPNPESVQGPPPFFTRQTLNVWLDSGKPMVVSEAADPISDRRFTVTVTATVIR